MADLRSDLESVRDRLLEELEHPDSSAAVASLSKHLVDVLVKLDALPVKEASAVDDLAAKRAKRRAGAPDASRKVGKRGTGGGSASS